MKFSKSDVNKAVVLNNVVLNPNLNSTLATNTPLSLAVIQKTFRLFNIKIYDFATNTLLHNLMPIQDNDKLVMLDVVNNVPNEIGTIATHELGNKI